MNKNCKIIKEIKLKNLDKTENPSRSFLFYTSQGIGNTAHFVPSQNRQKM